MMRKSAPSSNQFRKPNQAVKKVAEQRPKKFIPAGQKNGLPVVQTSIPSSDEELEVPAPIHKPTTTTKGSLKVSNATYKTITGLVSKVETVAKQRASIIRTHDALVTEINRGEVPGITRPRFPQPPPGCSFSTLFTTRYTDKANSYGRRLGCMLAAEYSTMITQHQSDLELIVNEGEDTLATIEDEEERRKAVKLFQLKYQSAVRRITRRTVKAKRRHPQNWVSDL